MTEHSDLLRQIAAMQRDIDDMEARMAALERQAALITDLSCRKCHYRLKVLSVRDTHIVPRHWTWHVTCDNCGVEEHRAVPAPDRKSRRATDDDTHD